MCIGIVAATKAEIAPFTAAMRNIETEEYSMLKFHKGNYAGIDVIALFCGVCRVNAAIAAQILIDRYQVEQIIVIGVAGAINPDLQIGDTVISSQVAYHDVADEILTQYHPWMESIYFTADPSLVHGISLANADDPSVMTGRIVTGESFIDQEGREEIIERYDPLCVAMETAGVAHVCYANTVPFAAIRSMSDTPHESGSGAFEKYCKTAAEKSVRVLIRYLDTAYR